ncbi:hemin uptake protein HemP [Aestuariibius insulae]|uniref:hemin uptake protein HemP n=1 Tax=Aestuariibius insulae TaxID=2058287 RepID=UPI00345E153A
MLIQKIPTAPAPKPATQASTGTYNARDLIADGVQTTIQLDEKTYVLRITKAGKLILTK